MKFVQKINGKIMRCENCGADVPKLFKSSEGTNLCCPHCIWNHLGCRCQYGEIGVAETVDYGQYDDEDDEDFDED